MAKGLIDINEVKKMHQHLIKNFGIDDVFLCPHQDSDKCKCRKPKIGLIKAAIKKYKIDVSRSFVIGDRISDILMANKIQCKSIFINRRYKEEIPNTQTVTTFSFFKAVEYIINKSNK